MSAPRKPPRRGDATGEWRGVTGVRNKVETGVFKGLDSLRLDDDPRGKDASGADPYNQDHEPASPLKPKRRTLDDMRQLSEKIKNDPTWNRPKK